MINERLRDYINSMDRTQSDLLENLYESATASGIPVIKRETAAFIRTVIEAQQPKKILEIGTAVGYSALFMLDCAGADLEITTIENYEKRIVDAKKNFVDAGVCGRIHLLEGDAGEILPALEGTFDLVFLDGPKGQYIHYLEQLKRLMRPGSILLSDNVLMDGSIWESRFAVERRDRTTHKRMREYLYTLTHDPQLVTSVLPLGDGVAFTVMK